jgi:hypothetical protein
MRSMGDGLANLTALTSLELYGCEHLRNVDGLAARYRIAECVGRFNSITNHHEAAVGGGLDGLCCPICVGIGVSHC